MRGLESRGLCLHILGGPEQNGEPHFSKEQQVVGKLPGAHLTRGPAVGSGNKHGKVPEAPGPGSENRLGACSDLGLLDKQLGWWPRIPAMGEGSASSSTCHSRLLATPRLPLPAQVTGSEARGGWEGRPGGGNGPADSRERPPWALPRGPSQAAGWGQAGTGPSVPRTHKGSRVTPPSPRGRRAGRSGGDRMRSWVGESPTQGGRAGTPSTRLPLGAPAAYQALNQTFVR